MLFKPLICPTLLQIGELKPMSEILLICSILYMSKWSASKVSRKNKYSTYVELIWLQNGLRPTILLTLFLVRSPLFVLLKRLTLVCRVPFPFTSWLRKKGRKREQIKLQHATMPTTAQKEGNKIIDQHHATFSAASIK